ncbi:MAG: trehalose-phosphatase [Gammaproteobacteria bacterium]|nr:trehalose-phosphatase [Gammaproteobacteria bacterium]
MQNIFSPAGRRALQAAMARRPLLAFDYDGTLAPIVPLPDVATTPVGIARRLARLARLRPVAIITGRAIEDVRMRLGFTPQAIIGNHGAEWECDVQPDTASKLDIARDRLAHHHHELTALGVRVEDKRLSLALHYRGARDALRAVARIHALLADAVNDVEVFDGKRVVNIVPRGAPDKGQALLRLVRATGVDSALFIGDDVNDEAVFRIAPPDWLTVRVGAVSAGSHAAFYLDTQSLVPLLLQDMIDLLSPEAS